MSTPAQTPAQYLGTGKRKTSVARVILRPGDGKTWVNGKSIEEYFPRVVHRKVIMAPLETTELSGQYDLRVRVHGGGPSGQAGAVRHGIARALDQFDSTFRKALRPGGFLTRDPRVVERKKYGHAKARRSFQFSDRKSTRLNSSHFQVSRMPSSA